MGLVLNLLAFPVMGPLKGVNWLTTTVHDQFHREVYDEERIRGELLELELRYEFGEIGEEEYESAEEELLARLEAAQHQ